MEFDLTIDGSSTDECFDFSLRHGTRVIPATFWNAEESSIDGRPSHCCSTADRCTRDMNFRTSSLVLSWPAQVVQFS